MTAPFASLIRFYLRAFYGFSDAARVPLPPGTAAGTKAARAKRILATIGLALLVILVVGDIGFIFGASYAAMYAALAPAGLQSLLLLNAAISAALIAFVVGFVTALSTYCLSPAEGSLLALPIGPRALFGAKFAMTYLADAALSFIMLAVAALVYGLGERPPVSFYLYAILVALASPLVPLALAYLLLVPIMSVSRFLRNRNVVLVLGGILGAAAALVVNFYLQNSLARAGDAAWIIANLAGPDTILARLGAVYPPAGLAARALAHAAAGRQLDALGAAALALGMGAAAALAVVLIFGPAYAASLPAFGEGRLKRIAKSDTAAYIERSFRRSPQLAALFLREWRLMNREPVYLINGPLVIVLFPVIIGITMAASPEAFAELEGVAHALGGGPAKALIAAALAAFLGTATSIAATALSREGRALPYLKSLPVSARSFFGAKLLHALVFTSIGTVLGAAAGAAALGLSVAETLAALAMALTYGTAFDLSALWLDTAYPRLVWETPTAALKQNPNAVIAILADMAALGGLGYLATRLSLGLGGITALYAGGAGLIALGLALFFPRYAEKRLGDIEL